MPKLPLLGSFLLLTASAFAGTVGCPNFYVVFPIPGVTGGSATSCGSASVDSTSAFAATPGKGSVDVNTLADYLSYDLSGFFNDEIVSAGEGSAVRLAGFTAPAGSTLTFNWTDFYEEGASGAVFYILNGDLTVLSSQVEGPTPCVTDITICSSGAPGGQVTVSLLETPNTLSFGAVVLNSNFIPAIALDPSITITNFSVASSGVPEPATLALTGAALLGLAAWRRRRA